MLLSEKQCRFTHHLALLILECDKLGFDVKIQELNRTIEQQKEYVAQGKSKTMNSKHLDKLAADIVLFKDKKICQEECYRPLGKFWEDLGNVWGGRFGLQPFEKATKIGWDYVHFELGEVEC